jgi:hypothetical protein
MAKLAKNAVSALLSAAAAVPKAKKSSVPDVVGFQKVADKVRKAYEAFKEAEGEFQVKAAEVVDAAKLLYEKRAKEGAFSKSFNFVGEATPGVQVTFADKFSEIPQENAPALREALGPEFGKHFEEKRVVVIKPEFTTDEALGKLLKKLGEKDFADYFEAKLTVCAKKDTDRDQFSLPDSVRMLLKQNKPAVKPII